MAVSTEHTKDILMGDGVNLKFPFTFQVIDKKQIKCLKVLASGEEIEVLNTEFDVNLNNSGVNGGEVIFPLLGEPLEAGIKFIIHRQTAIKQDYTPPNGQVFDAVAIKTEIDRLTMQNQEQEENIERAVKTSMSSDVKPEEYLDNVNEMLANARILQEEAVLVSAQNIEEALAQVEIAKEMADNATINAESSALSLKEATTQADKAGVEAEIAKHYAQMAQGLPIGMIVPIPVSKTPARFLPCDGSEWLQSQFSQVDLQGFYDKLVSGEVESVTYDEFDSQVSVNGVCGLCAIDSINGKFKTPLLNTSDGVYVRTGNVNGAYGAESLPNVKGITPIGGITSPSGCFATNGSFWGVGQGGQANYSVLFNASLSSSTYQDGAKVNPRSMTYKHYIVVYNGAVSASDAQASQFINSLNGKLNTNADNATSAGKKNITGWGMPDYAKVITINNTFFTAPSNGWIFMVASQSRILKPIVTRNGISTIVYDVGTYASDVICILVPTRIDDQWSNLTASEQLKFFPCIGG